MKVVCIHFDLFHRWWRWWAWAAAWVLNTFSLTIAFICIWSSPPLDCSIFETSPSLSHMAMTISRMAFAPNAHCGKMYLGESLPSLNRFTKLLSFTTSSTWWGWKEGISSSTGHVFNFCNYHFFSVIKHKQTKISQQLQALQRYLPNGFNLFLSPSPCCRYLISLLWPFKTLISAPYLLNSPHHPHRSRRRF